MHAFRKGGFCLAWLVFVISFLLSRATLANAFYTNMPANYVLGQNDFTSTFTGASSSKFSAVIRGVFIDPAGHLIVSDFGSNRVLIWNSVPTQSGVPADLVLGQANFSGVSANRGGSAAANTLSAPAGVFSDGTRLLIADHNNGRVLIWNSFPTTNGQAADLVMGKSSMTDATFTCDNKTLSNPYGVTMTADRKVAVVDRSANRVLIWNTFPTSNYPTADVVIGQSGFGTCTAQSISDKSLSDPRGIQVDAQGRFIVADRGRQRLLVWNSLPTVSNASANLVIGQPNFTTSGGSIAQNRVSSLIGFHSDGTKLFLNDLSRVLIFNQFPQINGPAADVVLGQQNFTTNTVNQGGSAAANTLASGAFFSYIYQNKLFVTDEANSRVLVYENQVRSPGLSLDNSPTNVADNQLQLKGTSRVDSPYTVKSVSYAVNGGDFSGATPTDGNFDSLQEDFKFSFDPHANQPKDAAGVAIDGYTVQVKSTNSNGDVADHLFYFSPFVLTGPADNATTTNSYPTFEFSVNKQRVALRENLDHYAVQVRDRSAGNGWTTLIDNIPVDFGSRKGDLENLQRETWQNTDVTDGSYETANFSATYSETGSHVSVHSKVTGLSGSYEWKVLAIDKAGHAQETGARSLIVAGSTGKVTAGFPLAILNLSGLGNPLISSYNLAGMRASYRTSSIAPVFYGIAWSGATIKLQLTEQNCSTACEQEFTTNANELSRFGINVPKGSLKFGKSYTVTLSSQFNDLFTQLPSFTLAIK